MSNEQLHHRGRCYRGGLRHRGDRRFEEVGGANGMPRGDLVLTAVQPGLALLPDC
jgi:hypothetical protein